MLLNLTLIIAVYAIARLVTTVLDHPQYAYWKPNAAWNWCLTTAVAAALIIALLAYSQWQEASRSSRGF